MNPWHPRIVATGAIFIHVPKTAGSAIKKDLYGSDILGHVGVVAFQDYDPARLSKTYKFCFVRNPWDRLLSAFSYLHQGRGTTAGDDRFAQAYLRHLPDFQAFLAALRDSRFRRQVMNYVHFRPQAWWVCLPGSSGHVMDFVGRFEHFATDMAEIRNRLDLPQRPLEQIRPSRHGDFRDAYDRHGRDLVAELYARDCKLFGYGFDS